MARRARVVHGSGDLVIRDLKVLDVLASEVVDGEIRVNVGDSQTGKGVGSSVPVWATYGFVSRPAEPTPGGACMGLVFVDGDQQRVIGTRDNRAAPGLASLRPGESLMYGPTGQFIRCDEDGAIMFYTTTTGDSDGRGVYFKVATDGFEMSCPWGRFTMGPLGIHFLHSSGARLDLGAIGGLTFPLDAFSSYARMEAGISSVSGGAVSIGTDGGAANEAAVAALITLLTALGVVINAAVDPTGIPTAAKGTFATALSTALPLLVGIGKVV